MGGSRAAEAQAGARPARYEIRVRGRLDPRWSVSFGSLSVAADHGETVITLPPIDQPGLRGILCRLWDLNLTLVSVSRLAGDEQGGER